MLLIRSLAPRPEDRPAIPAGVFLVHEGPIGLRGQVDFEPFRPLCEKLGPLLQSILPQRFGAVEEWHGVNVMVVCDPSNGVVSMCQVDGSDAADGMISSAVQALQWPGSLGSYMYKQFFLARPARLT
jgi:hypothetical protein